MNPQTRKAALYAIAAIAILASANALAHSYAGLYQWAVHHRLTGWQAMSWPAEIDVFLAVGELALYVAYLDAWPTRQRIWPWATALTGLAVSVAGNIGHIQAIPGEPVTLADRLTAATSPLAAFAGLSVGLLVVKMTRRYSARLLPGWRRWPRPLLPPCCRCDRSPPSHLRPLDPTLACSTMRPSSSRTPLPAASGSASAPWRGNCVATATISPTITCARSHKPLGWPVMPQPEQPAPSIQDRIQGASTLPETLAACFDAFEIIWLAASACVDQVSELFAAFMTTVGAAVDGREAITAAPSLPLGPADIQGSALAPNASWKRP